MVFPIWIEEFEKIKKEVKNEAKKQLKEDKKLTKGLSIFKPNYNQG